MDIVDSRCPICAAVLAEDLDAITDYLDGYYRSAYSMTHVLLTTEQAQQIGKIL